MKLLTPLLLAALAMNFCGSQASADYDFIHGLSGESWSTSSDGVELKISFSDDSAFDVEAIIHEDYNSESAIAYVMSTSGRYSVASANLLTLAFGEVFATKRSPKGSKWVALDSPCTNKHLRTLPLGKPMNVSNFGCMDSSVSNTIIGPEDHLSIQILSTTPSGFIYSLIGDAGGYAMEMFTHGR